MNEKTKTRIKGSKGKIVGRIIAAVMLACMLIGSCSTAIFYLINYFSNNA